MGATLAETLSEEMMKYGPKDQDWIRYVHDHRDYILARCTEYAISVDDQYTYRYRPTELLQKLNIPVEQEWIILWLNEIASAKDFVSIKSLTVPVDSSFVEDLYQEYLNWRTRMLGADNKLHAGME